MSFMRSIFTVSLAMHKLTQTRNAGGLTHYMVTDTNKNYQLPSERHWQKFKYMTWRKEGEN